MEVDPQPDPGGSTSSGTGSLKRSSSAPMINVLVATEPEAPVSQPPLRLSDMSRVRRLSSSSLNLNTHPHSLSHASPGVAKGTDRIHQIKREESVVREAEHERDVQSAMQMSNTLDDFNLDEPMTASTDHMRRPRSFSESLHIFTSPNMLCSSPSPTRVGKQCFSPSMQMPIRNNSFSPSPSPSPTRKSFHRSLSPIAVRPSVLGKRKMDETGTEIHTSSAKRFNFGCHTPDRLLTCMSHPLANSISSGSQGEESSPEQIVRRPSTPDHPAKFDCFGFTPVRDGTEMTTDSETSDITEHGDLSYSSGVHAPTPPIQLSPENSAFTRRPKNTQSR